MAFKPWLLWRAINMGKLSNIKSSISDPKTRLLWLMTAIMLIAVVAVTVLALKKSNSAVAASADIASAVAIAPHTSEDYRTVDGIFHRLYHTREEHHCNL